MPTYHSNLSLAAVSLAFALAQPVSSATPLLRGGAAPPFRVGFSSFVGGAGRDTVTGVAFAPDGSVIVAGETTSADLPVSNAAQAMRRGQTDAFVMKISADGSTILHATYVGGSADDRASGVAVDPAGNIYVTGVTTSLDFPVTPDAFDPENGRFPTCVGGDCIDSFVVRIPANGGPFDYATYLGGEHDDYAAGIAVDADGNTFVTGSTNSFGIPRDNAFEPDKKQGSEGFITKLNSSGSDVIFSSYIGGNRGDGGTAITVTSDGGAVFAGTSFSTDFLTKNPIQAVNGGGSSPETSLDGFVARVTSAGALSWSTYLGGAGRDAIRAVAVAPNGDVVVTGTTDSSSFPTVEPLQASPGGGGDAFVTRLSPDGSTIRNSTYLGGSNADELLAVTTSAGGDIIAVGLTRSPDFNVVSPVQEACGGCVAPGFFADAIIVRISESGTAAFATYFGATAEESASSVAVDSEGNVAVAGHTFSAGFPVTAGSFGALCPCPPGSAENGFVTTIVPEGSNITPPVISQVVSLKHPYRMTISGEAFADGVLVYIGADPTPWPTVTVGGPTLISLGGGKSLKARFPKRVAVTIRVVNPDGGEAMTIYAR
ncbi:MAG: SBBP repeat-containing protein [Blastocatellia bacterium]|nr:SBBP repeat-containing protein [Blastocatellia bacterium]